MALSTPRGNVAQQYQRSNWWNQPQAQASNPYAGGQADIASLVAQLRQGIGTPGAADGSSSGTGVWGTHIARPGDAAVQEYYDAQRMKQKQDMDEMVKRFATTSVQRGGVNVAGGPNMGASGFQQGTNTIAQNALTSLNRAMDYGKYVTGQQEQTSNRLMNLLQNAMGTQFQYDKAAGDWGGGIRNQQREDWQYDSGQAWDQWKNAGNMARQNQQANTQLNQGQFQWDQSQANDSLRNRVMLNQEGSMQPRGWQPALSGYAQSRQAIPNRWYAGG